MRNGTALLLIIFVLLLLTHEDCASKGVEWNYDGGKHTLGWKVWR